MYRSVSMRMTAALLGLTLVGAAQAQDFTPLPSVAPLDTASSKYDPNVAPVGAISVVAAEGADSPNAAHGLTSADVERIVAEYLARREAESAATTEAAEESLPQSVDPSSIAEPQWYAVGSDKKLSAEWNHGLELQSANKDFKVHVGGRVQFDTSFFSYDDYLEQPIPVGGIGPLQDSMQFRRARIRTDGTIYEQIEYAVEFEFLNDNSVDFAQTPALANTVPAATDIWVNFTKLPVLGNIKVGNQKNPIGLEHLESSRFLDFIERSFNQDLFYGPFNNGFSPGITASNTVFEKRATWAVGAFAANMNANTNIFAYGLGSDYAYTLRGTILPYFEQEGRYLVHLGASVEFRDADDGRVRVRNRGNIRNGPPGPFNSVYADTTSLIAEDQDLLNLEAVYQAGPLLVQGEYCFSTIYGAIQTIGVAAPTSRGNVNVHGGYIQALYFITGESRAYSDERGAFDRVIPYQNSFRVMSRNGRICHGPGAWQVGIRYDHADLNDSGINGGMLDALTLGINWFLNPNMKIQANWDWTHRGSVSRFVPDLGAVNSVGSGDVIGFGTRLAIDF